MIELELTKKLKNILPFENFWVINFDSGYCVVKPDGSVTYFPGRVSWADMDDEIGHRYCVREGNLGSPILNLGKNGKTVSLDDPNCLRDVVAYDGKYLTSVIYPHTAIGNFFNLPKDKLELFISNKQETISFRLPCADKGILVYFSSDSMTFLVCYVNDNKIIIIDNTL